MNKRSTNPSVETLLSKLKETDAQLGSIAKEVGQIRKSLQQALTELEKSPWPVHALESLQRNLNKPIQTAPKSDLDELSELIERSLGTIKQGFEQDFRKQLKVHADQQGIAYGTSGDNVTIGAFALIVDRRKDVATLEYAKSPCLVGLPFDANVIVTSAKECENELLQQPDNLGALCNELEEAICVALAREGKSTRLSECRAEFPAVYREMTFIRQVGKKPVSKKSFREYPLAQFVVEVATVIRSDENISASKSFRLETAVIENTGNRRKSVFIPKDLKKGYGEGMYYQAIILRQPS